MICPAASRIGSALVVAALLAVVPAAAQTPAPPPAGNPNPVCRQLEGQLASLDNGGADPARAEQTRRYEDAANKQQAELDRTVAQSRRMGCESSGFFSLFGGQPQQCGELTSRIQQMRANLDQMLTSLQRLQSGSTYQMGQRRGIMNALAQNNCGPQYQQATLQQQQPRGFFERLFNPGGAGGEEPGPNIAPSEAPASGTFRTLCVRTCDGYYYPISFSTVPGRFKDDERTCQRTCPAAEVALFTHHNPGEDVAQAVSLAGRRYTELPNAFRYRKEFSPTCSCRAAGQSWADALKNADDHVERGDVVVTEERAKQLSAPPAAGRPAAPRTAAKPDAQPLPPPAGPATTPADAASPGQSDPGQRTIRAVGPTFIPPR